MPEIDFTETKDTKSALPQAETPRRNREKFFLKRYDFIYLDHNDHLIGRFWFGWLLASPSDQIHLLRFETL
jgi:hypothetical protein